MTTKPSDNENEDDPEFFSKLMKGVTPIEQNKIDPDSTPKPKAKLKPGNSQRPSRPDPMQHYLGELEIVTPVSADEILSFVRGGIQDKLKTKLKKGLIAFEAKIDLHGATVKQAGRELQESIEQAHASGLRCILVVHGRGKGSFDNKPALKTHVNQWLRELPQVLAFHSAQPRHGGAGALYVLLKRQKQLQTPDE